MHPMGEESEIKAPSADQSDEAIKSLFTVLWGKHCKSTLRVNSLPMSIIIKSVAPTQLTEPTLSTCIYLPTVDLMPLPYKSPGVIVFIANQYNVPCCTNIGNVSQITILMEVRV